jgi:hypothetical protein
MSWDLGIGQHVLGLIYHSPFDAPAAHSPIFIAHLGHIHLVQIPNGENGEPMSSL